MSIPACHAGDPVSILGTGAKSGVNAMSFTSALVEMIPHSHMPNALLVAPDALTLSNPCWVNWVVREPGRI